MQLIVNGSPKLFTETTDSGFLLLTQILVRHIIESRNEKLNILSNRIILYFSVFTSNYNFKKE